MPTGIATECPRACLFGLPWFIILATPRQKLYARNIKLLVTPPLVAVRESIAKSVERADLKVRVPNHNGGFWNAIHMSVKGLMACDLALKKIGIHSKMNGYMDLETLQLGCVKGEGAVNSI